MGIIKRLVRVETVVRTGGKCEIIHQYGKQSLTLLYTLLEHTVANDD